MPVVVLIGRPGSGKSLVYRLLVECARAEGFEGDMARVDDYLILRAIVDADKGYKRHRPTPDGGLKITDDRVWIDMIRGLNERVLELMGPNKIIFAEFSRASYAETFKHFSPGVLRGALVVYVDCPWDVGWQRNVRRAIQEAGPDAHYLSKEEAETTYRSDDWIAFSETLAGMGASHVTTRNDRDGLGRLGPEIEKVVARMRELGMLGGG